MYYGLHALGIQIYVYVFLPRGLMGLQEVKLRPASKNNFETCYSIAFKA